MYYQLIVILMLCGDIVWWRWAHGRTLSWRRIALDTFMGVLILCTLRIIVTPFIAWHDANPAVVALTVTAYLWHLLALPLALLTIGANAILKRIRSKPKVQSESPATEPPPAGFRRREILTAVPPLLAGVAMGYSLSTLHRFRVRRIELPLHDLPAELDGMTIAQVCDTHIGRFTDDTQLRNIARATNDLDADLTLFIGDLIDVSQNDLDAGITFLKSLRGKFGVYCCEGNHDLIEDTAHDTNDFRTRTRAAGLPMLFDETATAIVRGYPIQLVGGKWSITPKARALRTQNLMRLVDPAAFSIFLSHHPHAWDQSIAPLTLSGHTHGGQLMINERLGVGPLFFKYWSGVYRRDNQALVVSNGTGNWYPLRINAPAEIVHLTLRRMA